MKKVLGNVAFWLLMVVIPLAFTIGFHYGYRETQAANYLRELRYINDTTFSGRGYWQEGYGHFRRNQPCQKYRHARFKARLDSLHKLYRDILFE